MDLKLLSCRLSALSVFRGILDKKEMGAFLEFLKAEDMFFNFLFLGKNLLFISIPYTCFNPQS